MATEANPTPPIALPMYKTVKDFAKYIVIHGINNVTVASSKHPFLPILSTNQAFTNEPGREAKSSMETIQEACS